MSRDFAELDFRSTPFGDLSLRRRRVRALDDLEVFEVKLGDAFLMSSLFHEVEVALADLGLAALDPGPGEDGTARYDVVVGGLGLGYTAVAALKHSAVRELIVVDALDAVIEWHQRGLVHSAPLSPAIRVAGWSTDFFALAASTPALTPLRQAALPRNPARYRSLPRNLLHAPRHLLFAAGLRLSLRIWASGVFALWS